ncbi:MAG TPA: enoyl-CoA hydratase/isomerase family protein, partial [Candidatus Lokiarchaeia archaeon]
MSTQDLILYEEKGRVAVITINRPDKAHAFNYIMLKAMHEKLIEANKNDKVRCIIIKSTGEKFFCAGYDLDEIMSNREIAGRIIEYGRKVNETILRLKKPVITQIQGISVGFGVLMTLASDLRIFADRPKEKLYLRLPEIAISAFPQTGATLLPLLAFGLSYAKNLLFTTDKIGVEELKNINFPTRI